MQSIENQHLLIEPKCASEETLIDTVTCNLKLLVYKDNTYSFLTS